jgi:hypothetical protein
LIGQEAPKAASLLPRDTIVALVKELKSGKDELLVNLVVNRGINPNAAITPHNGMTLTRIVTLNGDAATLEKICQLGGQPTGRDLYGAAARGDTNILEVLSRHGADVKYLFDFDGESAFSRAIRSGKLDAAKWLAAHGSPIQSELKVLPTDKQGVPLLERAVESVHCTPEIVDYLDSIGFHPTPELANKVPQDHPAGDAIKAEISKLATGK